MTELEHLKLGTPEIVGDIDNLPPDLPKTLYAILDDYLEGDTQELRLQLGLNQAREILAEQ